MSLLQYFSKLKAFPTAEETGIGEKHTTEVLKRQLLGQSIRKRKATAHSEEAWAKIGKYASINLD